MTELRLTHLTYASSGKPRAQVVFDSRLTVIYGASDTGKSFIVESIEYMLGGSTLNMIPEAEGYSQILLGLRLPDGNAATLVRKPDSNTVWLHYADLRDYVTESHDAQLTAVHSARSKRSVSLFILDQLGLRGAQIRTSDAGNTRPLNLRDLVHLTMVTETRMVDPVPPALHGHAAKGKTAAKSVVKFMLTGEDAPVIDTGPTYGQRRVHKGQIHLLDQIVLELYGKLTTQENGSQLRDRQARIRATIDQQSQSMRSATDRHHSVVADRTVITQKLAELENRNIETSDLLARFGLLEKQYRSDLDRLAMVREVGSLLGYFRTGTCPFCGADPEHQHAGHSERETTQLREAVEAESAKTHGLLSDLVITIDDLHTQYDELRDQQDRSRGQARRLDSAITEVEEQLAPLRTRMDELLTVRSTIERDLELHARIQELEEKRSLLDGQGAVPTTRPAQLIPTRVLSAFDSVLQHTLRTWNVPGVDYAEYDQYNGEVRAGNRPRAGRGKGVRSVLHSAFSLALARFCLDHELPHPGFVVLDSPVVTYREPVGGDVSITTHVVDDFYHDLLTFLGQAIIVENGDPPADMLNGIHCYQFTGHNRGRLGFFPSTAATTRSSPTRLAHLRPRQEPSS